VAASDSDFVRVDSSGQLELSGRLFVPRGVNSYPLLQHAGRARLDALDDILAQAVALDRPLVRTNAFLDVGDSPARIRDERGQLREQGLAALDRVLCCAADRGVRLILTLTNNWPDFGGAPAVVKLVAPSEQLAKNAFWTDPRAIAAQLSYQTALATRINSLNGRVYGEDPTIFAWELCNEARCERGLLQAFAKHDTLVQWAKRMSDGLRSAGIRQLIAWGGSGYLGRYGEDLRAIAAGAGVDVLTLHMYASAISDAPSGSAQAAIAYGEASLWERAEVAERARMPLLLEEVNWLPRSDRDRDRERATVLSAWLGLAADLGIGTLPWMVAERGRADHDGYLIRPEDAATCELLRRK
jgi:mannan endo-1,4-beta-mannosidase